jgi:hypothetical protein
MYLEGAGFKPVPVIHSLDADEINAYVQRKSKYPLVAIGSTQAKQEDELVRAVDLLYAENIKVHVFGLGSFMRLRELKAWSVDCSSFAQWTSVGRVIFFSEYLGKEITFSFLPEDGSGKLNEDYIYSESFNESDIVLKEYQDFVGELGLDVDHLFHDSRLRTIANSHYFHLLEHRITLGQMKRGIVFDLW